MNYLIKIFIPQSRLDVGGMNALVLLHVSGPVARKSASELGFTGSDDAHDVA